MSRKRNPGNGKPRGKNLKRNNGYIINQHGVKVTEEELKQLKNMAARVNYKRQKMIEKYEDQPLTYGGKPTPASRLQLSLMGRENDIIIRKRHAAINAFRTKGEFNKYMKGLNKALETDYLQVRAKQYKKNLMTKIQSAYGNYPDAIKGVLMKIQMTPLNKFMDMVAQDEIMEIKTHYQTGDELGRINALRDYLGLKPMEYDYIEDV